MPILNRLLEMSLYLMFAAVAAALIGAFASGVGQLNGLADGPANHLGWGACLTAFAFFAVTGRPMTAER